MSILEEFSALKMPLSLPYTSMGGVIYCSKTCLTFRTCFWGDFFFRRGKRWQSDLKCSATQKNLCAHTLIVIDGANPLQFQSMQKICDACEQGCRTPFTWGGDDLFLDRMQILAQNPRIHRALLSAMYKQYAVSSQAPSSGSKNVMFYIYV